MQVPFAPAHYQWHAAGSKAADSASGDGTGGEPGCAGGRSDESAIETGGAAEGTGKSRNREGAAGQPAAHHHKHGDRAMERGRGRTAAGLVRRARVCLCGAIGTDGKNAEPGAVAKPEVSGAGGQNHRPATLGHSTDQRHAANHRDAVALRRFSVLSDDVSPSVSEWRCSAVPGNLLPVRKRAVTLLRE